MYFPSFPDNEQKLFSFFTLSFTRGCRNCILRVHKYIFRKIFFKSWNFFHLWLMSESLSACFMTNFDAVVKIFFKSCNFFHLWSMSENLSACFMTIFDAVVKTAFYVSTWTFSRILSNEVMAFRQKRLRRFVKSAFH